MDQHDNLLNTKFQSDTKNNRVIHLSDLLFQTYPSNLESSPANALKFNSSLSTSSNHHPSSTSSNEVEIELQKCMDQWNQMDKSKYPFKLKYNPGINSNIRIEKDGMILNYIEYDTQKKLLYTNHRIYFTCPSKSNGPQRPQSNQFYFDDLEHLLRFLYINRFLKNDFGNHKTKLMTA